MAAVEEQIGRLCEGINCDARVMLRYGRYCDPCRAKVRTKRKLYVSNDLIDQRLRAIYLKPDRKRSGDLSVKKLAAQIHWPKWALTKRAAQLGLSRVKESPWSESELAILRRYAWMPPQRIGLRLKAAGFHRTATAIDVKLDRTYARRNTPYLTGNGVATLFGIDRHCVARWINLGYLHATRRGTERHQGNGGDMYLIHENDIRKFIFARPLEFDIRKVDQLWFLDLITEGKIAGA